MWRLAAIVVVMMSVSGCGPDAPHCSGELWPEADALFHRDKRWIGGDGAYSVDLGQERVLWLFGDSFNAQTTEGGRRDSVMVRNSVAIQTGYDPSRAFLQFSWREEDKKPASFLPEEGATWFWPAHGIRLDDVLLLFFERLGSPS